MDRISTLAKQIARQFRKTTDFAAMDVSADTECMLSFVHLGDRDLLVSKSRAHKLWFMSEPGTRGHLMHALQVPVSDAFGLSA